MASRKARRAQRTLQKKSNPQTAQQQVSSQEEPSGVGIIRHEERFAGPLPSPKILEHYDTIVPGAAERIIIVFESEVKHRQGLEARAIEAQVEDAKAGRREARMGQVFGLLIGLTGIIAGAVVGGTVGSVIGGATVIALVTAFIAGRAIPRQRTQKE